MDVRSQVTWHWVMVGVQFLIKWTKNTNAHPFVHSIYDVVSFKTAKGVRGSHQ